MNQFLASVILAAVVLALVYVFMRVMRLEKDVKELRNRAPPMDLAQAVWGMASEPPPPAEVHFAPPQMPAEMFATHAPASNEALIEEELQEEEEELVEAFQEAAPPEVPSVPPESTEAPAEQPVVNPNPTATPVRRPTMRKKKQSTAEE